LTKLSIELGVLFLQDRSPDSTERLKSDYDAGASSATVSLGAADCIRSSHDYRRRTIPGTAAVSRRQPIRRHNIVASAASRAAT